MSNDKPIKTINDYISHAMDLARDEERQKVVAWLREYCRWSENDGVANAIERGDHLKEVTND